MKKKKVKEIKEIESIKAEINKEKNKDTDKKEKPMSDNIEEYFAKIDGTKEAQHARELLNADKNVDLKTDLTSQEIVYINVLKYNNEFLKQKGLKPVFDTFLNNYMRLKYSQERKSRDEFVRINNPQQSQTDNILNTMANVDSIIQSRK